jgi:aquaporin Z
MSKISESEKYIAESIDTFTIVFMSCGSAVIAGKLNGFMRIAFTFCLTVLAIVYAIGGISFISNCRCYDAHHE